MKHVNLSQYVSYIESLNLIVVNFEGFLSFEEFVERCEDALVWMKEKNSVSIIVDIEKMEVASPLGQKWMEEDFSPRVKKETSLENYVFVVPKEALAHESMRQINAPIIRKSMFNFVYLDDFDKAIQWIATNQ